MWSFYIWSRTGQFFPPPCKERKRERRQRNFKQQITKKQAIQFLKTAFSPAETRNSFSVLIKYTLLILSKADQCEIELYHSYVSSKKSKGYETPEKEAMTKLYFVVSVFVFCFVVVFQKPFCCILARGHELGILIAAMKECCRVLVWVCLLLCCKASSLKAQSSLCQSTSSKWELFNSSDEFGAGEAAQWTVLSLVNGNVVLLWHFRLLSVALC